MSKEAMTRVRDAEAQAANIRAEAAAEAARMRQENEKTCAAAAKERLNATAAALKERLAVVQQKADALVEQSRLEAAEDARGLIEAASEHRLEAVKVVVWEMFDSCR